MNQEQIAKELMKSGFSLAGHELGQLQTYLELLVKWNRVVNLVGHSDWKFILNDLILDSFHLGSFLSALPLDNNPTVLDLGAGAGLPGIPLRLVWNRGRYYLVESRTKRAVFMTQAIAAMNISNTLVMNCRVEEIDSRVLPAELIISRAFRPWKELLPLSGEMLARGGKLIIMGKEAFQGQDLPGFEMIKTREYLVNSKKRYLWALESNI